MRVVEQRSLSTLSGIPQRIKGSCVLSLRRTEQEGLNSRQRSLKLFLWVHSSTVSSTLNMFAAKVSTYTYVEKRSNESHLTGSLKSSRR